MISSLGNETRNIKELQRLRNSVRAESSGHRAEQQAPETDGAPMCLHHEDRKEPQDEWLRQRKPKHALNWPLKETGRHGNKTSLYHEQRPPDSLSIRPEWALSLSQCICPSSHIHPRIKLPLLSILPLRNPEVYPRHSGANHLSSGAAAVKPGEGMATRRQGEGQS